VSGPSVRRALDTASWLCGWVASACLAAMMLLTVADVVLRAAFNRPIRGVYELVELLLCATFFVALPAVFLRDEHIVVDSIDRYAPRAVPWLRRVAGLVAVAMLSLMAWQGGVAARDTWSFGDVTPDLALPKILFWIPLLFGLAAGAVAALATLFRTRTLISWGASTAPQTPRLGDGAAQPRRPSGSGSQRT
jgi:TRAP-type C4-dicarboxylate transport system permease small subunit